MKSVNILEKEKFDDHEKRLILCALSGLKLLIVHDPGLLLERLEILNKELNAKVQFQEPKFGRFDLYQSLIRQIEMSKKRVEEFDLIDFIIDDPSVYKDLEDAGKVLDFKRKLPEFTKLGELIEKVNKINPKISSEAKELIVKESNNYLLLKSGPRAPFTSRSLFVLTKLSEAYAKIRLSDIVEKEDAVNAVELLMS